MRGLRRPKFFATMQRVICASASLTWFEFVRLKSKTKQSTLTFMILFVCHNVLQPEAGLGDLCIEACGSILEKLLQRSSVACHRTVIEHFAQAGFLFRTLGNRCPHLTCINVRCIDKAVASCGSLQLTAPDIFLFARHRGWRTECM